MNPNIDFTLLGENLDGLCEAELAAIGFNSIGVRPITLAEKLFPDNPRGRVRATKDLHNYAANLATAMALRKRGEIARALDYEKICDSIYQRLPAWARF